jgi:outer membrane receptor protein involved in Fe transport
MFFPSIYLGYDINMHHQLTGNFSSRMRRPGHWDLNPITNYDDPLNLSRGNPALRPENHYLFELGYMMNYDKTTLTATLFHRFSTDGIERFRSILNDDTTISMPMNISRSSRTGFEFIYMQQILS